MPRPTSCAPLAYLTAGGTAFACSGVTRGKSHGRPFLTSFVSAIFTTCRASLPARNRTLRKPFRSGAMRVHGGKKRDSPTVALKTPEPPFRGPPPSRCLAKSLKVEWLRCRQITPPPHQHSFHPRSRGKRTAVAADRRSPQVLKQTTFAFKSCFIFLGSRARQSTLLLHTIIILKLGMP